MREIGLISHSPPETTGVKGKKEGKKERREASCDARERVFVGARLEID
jgi:hypothetical protein